MKTTTDEIRQTWPLGKGDTLNEVGASEVIHDLCDEVDRLREAIDDFGDIMESHEEIRDAAIRAFHELNDPTGHEREVCQMLRDALGEEALNDE